MSPRAMPAPTVSPTPGPEDHSEEGEEEEEAKDRDKALQKAKAKPHVAEVTAHTPTAEAMRHVESARAVAKRHDTAHPRVFANGGGDGLALRNPIHSSGAEGRKTDTD